MLLSIKHIIITQNARRGGPFAAHTRSTHTWFIQGGALKRPIFKDKL